jgi:glutamate/tyrosine decarboxylase-like PLP-dependent enzyme
MISNDISLVRDAMDRALTYVHSVRDGRVTPTPEAIAALDALTQALPDHPVDPVDVLHQLDEIGSPATVHSAGGRYFGFVTGGVEPVALAAAILGAAWDQNIALPVMSPVAARLDAIATRWVTELLGLPPSAMTTFCSGASVANLTCIIAARDALLERSGWSVEADGLFGAPPIRVVATAEAHVTVRRALRIAGIGTGHVTWLATDDNGRARADELPEMDAATLVLLQAGNVNTGHSDPFDVIIPHARRGGAWVHVDGAFGLWAAASPSLRHLVAGVELADSWATDAHKWLNTTYDAGIAICARDIDLRRAMTMTAAYAASTDERALMQLGMQMSQRARAVETWAVLASKGRSGVAELIERHVALAAHLARRLVDGGVELLAPVVLNQALVAFGDDATTQAVVAAVQDEGTCWAGGTIWKGRAAMRLSVSDTSTTADDIDRTADAILRCFNATRTALG